MKQTNNFALNISKLFYFLFIFFIFFPIRYVFPTFSSFQTGFYSDFTSISLYLSDIFLFLAFLFIFYTDLKLFLRIIKPLWIWIVWLIIILLWHFKSISGLNIYYFGKFIELIVAYGTTIFIFKQFPDFKGKLFKFFIILASFQSFLAIYQFTFQKPLGLFKLGEQIIIPQIIGIAKIVVNSVTYVRGYGTFPHPNLLSAFLVVAIFLAIYLLLVSVRIREKIAYSCVILINILGLTVTFSRAGFLALGVGLIIYFGFTLLGKNLSPDEGRGQRRGRIGVLTIVLLSLLISFFVFRPYLITRATISDQATIERALYNQISLKIIKDKPVFGIGMGESVLHMQQYSDVKLWPWQIQPIHNFFLLLAAELGIVGMLIFIWIFFSHLKAIFSAFRRSSDLSSEALAKGGALAKEDYILLATILVCFLILMQFDHYFYTLQQTQMLLWIILGLIAAETQTKNETSAKFKGAYLDILLFLILFAYSFKILSLNRIVILGYLITLTGAALWLMARYQLGDAFSVFPKATKIVKNGIYKKIRHPIYLAGIITVFGLCLIYQNLLFYIAFLALTIMQFIRARWEEKIFTAKFGQSYTDYKNSTWF